MKNIFKFSKFNENISDIFRRKETRGEKWKRQFAEYGLVVRDLKDNIIDLATSKEINCKIYYKDLLVGNIRSVKDRYYYIDYMIMDYYVYQSVWDKPAFIESYKNRFRKDWQDGLFPQVEIELLAQTEKPIGKVRFEANLSKPFEDQKFELIQRAFLAWQGTTRPGYTIYSKYFRSQNN